MPLIEPALVQMAADRAASGRKGAQAGRRRPHLSLKRPPAIAGSHRGTRREVARITRAARSGGGFGVRWAQLAAGCAPGGARADRYSDLRRLSRTRSEAGGSTSARTVIRLPQCGQAIELTESVLQRRSTQGSLHGRWRGGPSPTMRKRGPAPPSLPSAPRNAVCGGGGTTSARSAALAPSGTDHFRRQCRRKSRVFTLLPCHRCPPPQDRATPRQFGVSGRLRMDSVC